MGRSGGSVSQPAVLMLPTATAGASTGWGLRGLVASSTHVQHRPIVRTEAPPAPNLPWRLEKREENAMGHVNKLQMTWKQTFVKSVWRTIFQVPATRCLATLAGTAVRESWIHLQHALKKIQFRKSIASSKSRQKDAKSAPAPCCVTGYLVETCAKLVWRILN